MGVVLEKRIQVVGLQLQYLQKELKKVPTLTFGTKKVRRRYLDRRTLWSTGLEWLANDLDMTFSLRGL
jgi:hypothetical protein